MYERIIIKFRNGKTEQYDDADSYGIKEGCLYLLFRHGENRGTRYIPLHMIEEWRICR